MTEAASVRAVKLLINQAHDDIRESRYPAVLAAAGRAVQAAERLDHPGLLVRALGAEATALLMSGDPVAALARYTRVLGLAEDPATRGCLDDQAVTWAVAKAHMNWVGSAHFVTGIGVRELFGILDAAESWLSAIGHRDWRAGILFQRASLHQRLGELDTAIAAAQEALAVYQPDTPGYTLAAYRWNLGHFLRQVGRVGEAEPLYQAILDDPTTSPYDRKTALQGLAWCALAAQDPDTARRHATAAVQLADTIGDNVLRTALGVLIAACRADGDLDTAWQAATRGLDICRRLGGHHVLYHATRDVVDVALDRRDLDTATRLLTELDTHASALDTDTGKSRLADGVTRRRRRLAEIDIAP